MDNDKLPADERPAETDEAPGASAQDDVEGQMIGRAIAASGVMNAPKARRHVSDDDLKPLTKPFPSMKNETARK